MKATDLMLTDLMLGDWVQITGGEYPLPVDLPASLPQYARVVGIEADSVWTDFVEFGFMLGELEPIPLTPEILEKNGWKVYPTITFLRHNDRYELEYDCVCHTLEIFATAEDPEKLAKSIFLSYNIQFVHELQHALRLCGIEKEIVL